MKITKPLKENVTLAVAILLYRQARHFINEFFFMGIVQSCIAFPSQFGTSRLGSQLLVFLAQQAIAILRSNIILIVTAGNQRRK